jgi:GntR family trehalose operon transcriptional repressor
LLSNEGYIQTIRGKGSLILNTERLNFPISSVESYREVAEANGLEAENSLIAIQDHVLVLEQLLFGSPGMRAQLILRKRTVDDVPVTLDYDYVNEQVVPEVPAVAAQYSLFNYFEKNLNLKINYAVKHITIEPANDNDCCYLGVNQSVSMVVVRSETHLADNRVLGYTESRHRADKFSSVEFARRQSIHN